MRFSILACLPLLAVTALPQDVVVEDYPSTCKDACKAVNYKCDSKCICQNKMLGPSKFENKNPALKRVFDSYKALAPKCPLDWLNTSTNWNQTHEDVKYHYPGDNGFVKGTKKPGSPKVGDIVDRIGKPYGGFLAPALTPWNQRSIPGGNLNYRKENPPYNYFAYKVAHPFNACEGKIAPAFEQPGQGTQWYIPGGGDVLKPLVTNGTLQPVVPWLDEKGGVVWLEIGLMVQPDEATEELDYMYH
ncbi:hypothetical protein BDV25DRAFT_133056 [Aspergillus avenaceus]|uniref:TNT domain-containing protein n=1 Tax=Aspergillus avenaceus TaxID=36643 RepID=A0A5N6TIW4_ASPAV|nr:hypothetical protein BDV25DRAFT_133056 [Aspergillus avenaceus]